MRKWDDFREVNEPTARLRPRGPVPPLPLPLPLLLLLGAGLILVGLGAAGLREISMQMRSPKLLVEGVIVDEETGLPVEADVYLDGRLLYADVRQVSLRVPSGSELRIEAEGYAPWAFRFRYELRKEYRFHGPIRLTKQGAKAGEE